MEWILEVHMLRSLFILFVLLMTSLPSIAFAEGKPKTKPPVVKPAETKGDATRMRVAKQKKPSKAMIKSWLDPRGACPSADFAKSMEAQGYPHRKDCDKPRRIPMMGEIDNGHR